MNVKIGRDDLIHQFLILCAAWTSFLKMALGEAMHDGLAVISILFGLTLSAYAVCRLHIPRIIYMIWIVFILSGALNIVIVGNLYISVFISMMFSYFPIALNLVYAKRLNCSFWKISYIVAGIYMAYRMIHSPDGILLFENLSKNNLSVLLLAWLVIYAIVLEKNGRELPLWPVFLYAVCCVIAVGRAGVFTACLIAGCFWIYHFFYRTHHGFRVHARFLTGFLGIVAGILMLLYVGDWIIQKVFSRFMQIGFHGSEDRMDMVLDYFAKWNSFKAVIFGADRSQIASIVMRSGNPHNSYVFAHMYFGMTGFLFLIIGGVFIIRFLYQKKHFSMMILAAGYFLRIFTDAVFPGSFGGDTAYWIFLFFMIQQNRQGSRDCSQQGIEGKERRKDEVLQKMCYAGYKAGDYI